MVFRLRAASPVTIARIVAHAGALLVAAAVGLFCARGALAAQPPFGERPWLGVSMEADAPTPGVRVSHVVRGSPADRGGLREGDRLVRIGATRVVRGADVLRAVAAHSVGETLELAFVRGTAEQTARAALAPFPAPDDLLRMDLVGAFAPSWKDIEGVSGTFPQSIGALRGRVVVLDFWATWCGPCRVVIPKLGQLQSRYGAQGLSVLGVSTEDVADVALFARERAIGYGVGVDRHAETTRSYGVSSLPTMVVIDKRGVVRDVSVGYEGGDEERLERTVRSLLGEPAGP